MNTIRVVALLRACRRRETGFTLLEVTITLVIGGILAAIAYPSFLDQANKAKQAEAKTYVGSMNRAQQAHLLEHSRFASSLGDLGLDITQQTINYRYGTNTGPDDRVYAVQFAQSLSPTLKPFSGITAVVQSGSDAAVVTLLCESDAKAAGKAPAPRYDSADRSIACATGSREMAQ
ncbi:prepilin-type N-terminal cleavage/methylation domain-containing protein [Leptolyngbya sp. FACHB-36]|uniref:type IV pilin-like G/H family protein n=1 Tax=Leptolyngbya sp. FACHB-36 TaxID=2692808 RepID=UPI001680CC30|nr:prepilin-type N-terminal cleavage/methylation domain-containing protein [Leptolyngbya sp. FACHB-36]